MIARLSSPVEDLKDHYEVVVVGSGYGGAIAACRLARAGRQVCLLERGKELQPGEYPDTFPEAWDEMQIDSPFGRVGSRTALYDMRVNEDLSVFLGCGLEGTSLVNANVCLRADERSSVIRGGLRGCGRIWGRWWRTVTGMLRRCSNPCGCPIVWF